MEKYPFPRLKTRYETLIEYFLAIIPQSYFPISCQWFLRVLLFPPPSVTIFSLFPHGETRFSHRHIDTVFTRSYLNLITTLLLAASETTRAKYRVHLWVKGLSIEFTRLIWAWNVIAIQSSETVAETGSTPLRCRSFFKNNSRTSGKIISSVRDNSSLYSTQIFIDGPFRVDLTFYLWNLFIELI